MKVQRIELDGRRYVVLPENEYERLCSCAGESVPLNDDDLPPLPKADKKGRFPAVEYARISLARDIIRGRKAAGLTQSELANLAGIRQETLSRIEGAKRDAAPATVDKIQSALERQQKAKHKHKPTPSK